MWMIYTAIGLGIALALVALYLLSCIRVLERVRAGSDFPAGPGHAHAQGTGG